MKRSVALLVCWCAAVSFAASDFWTQKTYDKWSASECKKILSDSPWAKTIKIQKTNLRQLNRETGGERNATAARGSRPTAPADDPNSVIAPGTQSMAAADQGTGNSTQEITYTAQIRSATPVRQAFIRMRQIDSKYDSLEGDKKTKADEAYARYLGQQFPDKIVVLVIYGANLPDNDRALANYWQNQTLDTLKSSVFLSGPDGDRMEPIAYVGGGGALREFQFVFPRNPAAAQGAPDKPLVFEIDHPASSAMSATSPLDANQPGVGNEPKQRLYFKFPTKDMTLAGKTVY